MRDLDQLLKIQHGERNLKFGVNNLRKKKLCEIFMFEFNFNGRDRLFNKNVINGSNYSQVSSECCLISNFEARKFWCIFVLAILKTKPFSHHLSKCNFMQNLDF